MLTGYVWFENGWVFVKVEGFPRVRYLWYNKREAVKKYRETHGLKYRKINWM